MKARRVALLGAVWLCGTAALAAQEVRTNAFGDPFFAISNALPDCPLPAGPFITHAETLAETHHRAERGTTCWLAGKCSKPNSYAYDAGIAQALKHKLATANPFTDSTLWVTVQGRVVYIEGCARKPGLEPAIEAFVAALPDVQRAVAAIRTDPRARPPYKLRSAP
jgi:hypothetical protein